ncbi:MAG: SIS domain-containing protein, partial [Coriobacteriales bacterium]
MKEETMNILKALSRRFPSLQPLEESIAVAAALMRDCFLSGGTLYLCGNGGSAADCEHIAGELLKSFKLSRPLPGKFREALLS